MRPESKDPVPRSGRFWLAAVAVGALLLSPVVVGAETTAAHAAPAACGVGMAPTNGTGTEADPYLIASKDNLIWVSWASSSLNTAVSPAVTRAKALAASYKQTADIDLEGCDWTLVGINDGSAEFSGQFDGNNKTIGNLKVDRTSDYGGMFGLTSTSAVIKNVRLKDVDVTARSAVGGLVGFNDGTIENSSVDGSKVAGIPGTSGSGNQVGGLVGANRGNIKNSHASVAVTGPNIEIGGLVGSNGGTGTIKDSYATGTVGGVGVLGGLVGFSSGTIEDSYATGVVNGTGTGSKIGGLVGHHSGATGAITDSHATGDVVGGSMNEAGGLAGTSSRPISNSYATGAVATNGISVGGLVGNNTATITNSYATGAVDGDGNVGGLVGLHATATITNSYATGAVTLSGTTTTNVGGLVGEKSSGAITNSFWDTQTSLQADSDGGNGKTTAEMQSLTTFTGTTPAWAIVSAWEAFSSSGKIWGLCEAGSEVGFNGGYPYLLWQATSNPCAVVSHVVTFNSQDGSAVANGSYVTGGTVVLPAAPTRAGFTFAGWFETESGGTAVVSPFSPNGTGAITLFAQWTAVPAAAAPSAPSALAATGASLPLAAPMGVAMLLLAAGGFALLESRRRVGRRA